MSGQATRKATIEEQFVAFHNENPEVFWALRRMALELVAQGHTSFGIATIYEALRYSRMRTTGDEFRLNNNFRASYSRLLMESEPRLRGVFPIRELRAPVRSEIDQPAYTVDPKTGQGMLA